MSPRPAHHLRVFRTFFTSLNPSLSLHFVSQHSLDLSGRKVTTEVLKTVAETCAANLSSIKLNSLANDLNYQVCIYIYKMNLC